MFGIGKDAAVPANLTVEQKKQALMDQVRKEMALANAQELIQKVTEHCYQTCLPKPGSSFSAGDKACTSRCMDRYLDAWNAVSKAYIARIQQANGGAVDAGLF